MGIACSRTSAAVIVLCFYGNSSKTMNNGTLKLNMIAVSVIAVSVIAVSVIAAV